MKAYLEAEGAQSVRTIAMVDKLTEHSVDLTLDYCGFEAPDGKEWLVGYGMDVKEKYRSLPFIAAVYPQLEAPSLEHSQTQVEYSSSST